MKSKKGRGKAKQPFGKLENLPPRKTGDVKGGNVSAVREDKLAANHNEAFVR